MTSDGVKPKRRGRPSLPGDEKKRITMTFRVREATRDEIAETAEKNQRSISEEIEYRLINYNNSSAFTENAIKAKINELALDQWNESNKQISASFIKELLEKKFLNILHSSEVLKDDLRSLIDTFSEFGLKSE